MTRPPLGVSAVVTDAAGASTRLGAEDLNPENIPQGLTWSTQRMQGFAAASLALARRIDRDYVDVHLLDSAEIIGDDGSTAYEGRISALPRSMDTAHSIGLSLQGWMGEMKRRKFAAIFVDRDLSAWGPASTTLKLDLLSVGYGQVADPSVTPDLTGRAAVHLGITGSWGTALKPLVFAVYDGGPGVSLGRITGTVTRGAFVASGDANWDYRVLLGSNDRFTTSDSTGDIHAAGPVAANLAATVAGRRFAALQLSYELAPGGTVGQAYEVEWSDLAVYGDHGLPLLGTAPKGVAASDVLRYIVTRYCPKLNPAGIGDTTYPIPHLAFRNRTFPYDALLELNKFHLWDCSVWEKRTVHYGGIDLTDYDWEIRLDDPGVTTSLQGDDIEQLANGVAVEFQNVATGQTQVLTPDEYPELRDDSVENPFNQHGDQAWLEYSISVPTTLDAALQIGRAALAEFNAPKAPGTITVQHYIRDRQGHWQPVWKVRANDRVAITSSSSLSDRPRVIHETTYNHDNYTLSMAVDSTFKRLDAEIDRISTALAAAGLT